MNILKVTIPTGALLISTLMAGTAIANNEIGAATVEELIVNDTLAQENPLITPKDVQSYQMASDDDADECDDDDEDEDEDDDENETDDDEDEDEDDDEYAACADQPVTSQG